ncbi:MAG TPA: hypothetical protein VKR53_13775, partial [Puia sp.]|nr:hypothetical protein [Puia sp.]
MSVFFAATFISFAQDSTSFKWEASSKKIGDHVYELHFSTDAINGWQLYSANQSISGVASAELTFPDSLIKVDTVYKETGNGKTIQNKIFDNASFRVYQGKVEWVTTIHINETVPETLSGTFKYTYGKNDQFYSLAPFSFAVKLAGGVRATA